MIRSNEFHTYFRVNSVFWDPNVYGRYLALVIVIATAALLWARERRDLRPADGADRGALARPAAQTFSQSSFIALLGGPGGAGGARAGAGAGRWRRSALGAVGGVLVVLFAGGSRKLSLDRLNIDTSGRANLVSGGLDLFAERPLWGYGSGSFQAAYREHIERTRTPRSPSPTPSRSPSPPSRAWSASPLYVALIVVALWTMAGAGLPWLGRASARAARGPRRGPRRLRRPAGPHDGLRRLLRGPDHLGAAGASAHRWRAAAVRDPRRVDAVSGYLRRLATTGAAYTAASILSKLIAVALLPLYTRYLTPADYGAAEVMFAAVVAVSIVVRFGLIEALLRFYYKDDEDPDRVVASTFAGLFWFSTARRADRPALRRADLRSAARPRPGSPPELARISIGGLWVLTMFEFLLTLFRLEERARAFFVDHDPQRPRRDRADRRPRRRRRRGRPRPAARQLRQRRRLRPRPDRRPAAPALAALRPRAAAAAAALRPADDAGRGLALPAQLRRPDHHRPHRRPRRGRPLLAGGQVRPGGQRPRPRLPARLAAARLLDPRRRRGPPRLRHRRHLFVAGCAFVVTGMWLFSRWIVRALAAPEFFDSYEAVGLISTARHPLRPLHGAGRDPRPHRPHRVQLPGHDRRPRRQRRPQPAPRAVAGDRRRRHRPGRLLPGRAGADVRVHPAPLPGPLRVGPPGPGRRSSPRPWSASASCCCRPTASSACSAAPSSRSPTRSPSSPAASSPRASAPGSPACATPASWSPSSARLRAEPAAVDGRVPEAYEVERMDEDPA